MTSATPDDPHPNVRGVCESRHAGAIRSAFVIAALTFALTMPDLSFAEEPSRVAPTPQTPRLVLSWETGEGKSYLIPGVEIIAHLFLLNQYDRHFAEPYSERQAYRTSPRSFWKNLSDANWVVDSDPFSTNQFLHPLGGTFYYGYARSAGLNFWESLLYAEAGSFLWELGGETGPPSINDQITTPFGGAFLGEPLFRMASLLLEKSEGAPGFWRELGAFLISPPTGFNRLVFGNRFDAVYPSRNPATFTRLQIGSSLTSFVSNQNISQVPKRAEANVDFSMVYGQPGKPGYSYTRPFDYFNFQFTGSTANIFENIITRGLLIGTDYGIGDYRGIWGLYGSYDYIAPQIFRVSSAALSFGSTGQWWLTRLLALQGTALGGLGYGAAGTIRGTGERDYHYGATPQGLLDFRLIFGDVAMFNTAIREYYVSGVGSTESRGSENVIRGEASLTMRVYGRHAIAIQYVMSHRDAEYPDLPGRHQTLGTVGLFYNFLGHEGFGAVEWRGADAGPLTR
jgi:hypothetical protein